MNKLEYNGGYWPEKIESNTDPELLKWIEERIWLYPLYPRRSSYDVLADTHVTPENAKALSDAARACWDAVVARDARAFGEQMRKAFEAQIAMFPNMMYDDIQEEIDRHKNSVLGWKLSGAGGGGYLIFVSEQPVEKAIQIHIRR